MIVWPLICYIVGFVNVLFICLMFGGRYNFGVVIIDFAFALWDLIVGK